jgi:hypothetical protein
MLLPMRNQEKLKRQKQTEKFLKNKEQKKEQTNFNYIDDNFICRRVGQFHVRSV